MVYFDMVGVVETIWYSWCTWCGLVKFPVVWWVSCGLV